MELSRRLSRITVGRGPLRPVFKEIWAVDETIAPGSVYPAQILDRTLLLLTETGQARSELRSQTLLHRRDCLIVVKKGTRMQELAGAAPWHVRYLMLAGAAAVQVDRLIAAHRDEAFVYDPAPNGMLRLLDEAVGLALDQPPQWQWLLLSRVAELWARIALHPSPALGPHGLVSRVRRLVEQSPQRAWSVEALAGVLHVSSSKLAHRFREETGEPPVRYVRRHRVEVARRLLRQGLKVVQVADRLGFADAFHFSRVFKTVTGVPPSAVKAAAQRSPLHEN